VIDEAMCHAFAAVLRKHIKVTNLAQTTPFDVKHGRDSDNGLRRLAIRYKRTPTQGIGEHSVEVLGDPRQRSCELLLAEESPR
jgi:hypothetical protein